MSLESKYNPQSIEDKWYKTWLENGLFKSTPDSRPSYTIVIPPPNVTGVLHMGHMLNNTIQDVLIRRARMQGYNACWVPGTDHASIATEAKVVNKLKEEGITKQSIGRKKFLEHAWEWKEKHGGIILEQLKKLGASCDWDRTRFTMEEKFSDAVIKVFIDLYDKGLIYRGYRMVNWDPKAQTAVSDEEVIFKEVDSQLYYVKYFLKNSNEFITIATTRPETIMGDTAVCVHPNDTRYTHLHGKTVIVPLVNREVPVITDDYIDIEFGTGVLKVTPAHDINDYNIGLKHNLAFIDTINADGTISAKAEVLVGEDRFVARKKMKKLLEDSGNLLKIEPYKNKVGFSERTDEVIEPKLSIQWFLNMEKMAKPALEAVLNNQINLIPNKFVNTYKHWMENIRDWCISRQLWWGHQIPAYYYGPDKDDFVVANTKEEALEKAKQKTQNLNLVASDLKQDDDVLDTWFSAWLWPISVFDGFENPNNSDLKYYYPTKVLVTAPEILFFWVARMVMAGIEFTNKIPFHDVYLTGIVRDKLGRKMSKSLGNSPDPIDLINKYGADGVRVGMLLSSPAGNDLLFDEKLCEQGRNFSNKIWNAYRLLQTLEVQKIPQPTSAQIAEDWIKNRIAETLNILDDNYAKYRISDALMATYKLIWDDFCSWYLELIKPEFGKPIDFETHQNSLAIFEVLMQIVHPFMPFISEELYQNIKTRKPNDFIMVSTWPTETELNNQTLSKFKFSAEIISEIRNIRNASGISPKETLQLVANNLTDFYVDVVKKLANVSDVTLLIEKPESAKSFIINGVEFFVPMSNKIDTNEEIEKLQKELDYTLGFLKSVSGKLNNQKFITGAPKQVVENELKKKADAETKIDLLREQIKSLQ